MTELCDDLAAIVLDTAAEPDERVAAGWAVSRLASPHRTSALRRLALTTSANEDDPADELKGVALLATWPHAMTNAEALSVLTPRRQTHFHGAYSVFLHEFRERMTATDIDAGLRWLLRDLDAPNDDPDLAALANRILTLAATRPLDPVVVDAFARVVLARAEHHDGLLFADYRNDPREDPLADPVLRRAVAVAVLRTVPDPWMLHALAVVRAEDLAWIAELYVEADTASRASLRRLFCWVFDGDRLEHCDLVVSMARTHPLHADLVHTWVDPVLLDSPEADEQRRQHQSRRRPRPDAPRDDDIAERIEQLLSRFDAGEAVGFWYSARLLTVVPGGQHFGAEYNPDLSGMKRWPTLSQSLRDRLVEAAERYLREYPCEPQNWLDQPDLRHYTAQAGYRAMVLLLRLAPERLRRLPEAVWIEWAPVLASTTTALANGATWQDKERLLDLAGPRGHQAARTALLTWVEAAVSAGRRPGVSNEARYLWDTVVSTGYLALVPIAGPDARGELVDTLADRDVDQVRDLLLEWLADPCDLDRRRLSACTLLNTDLERSWPALRAVFDADRGFALDVLGQVLHVRAHERDDDVQAPTLADIYLWLRAAFPPETDPAPGDEALAFGPRDEIGRWREQILRHLRDAATPQAVEALRTITSALPDDRWLPRTLAAAQAALRRSQWTPTHRYSSSLSSPAIIGQSSSTTPRRSRQRRRPHSRRSRHS